MRDCRPRLLAATLLVSALVASPVVAQDAHGHLDDASTPPRGLLRLRAISAWTRYDETFTNTGKAPLGAWLSANPLGSATGFALSGIEARIQSAAASPFVLSLGHSRLGATGREEVLPIGLEYGITNRFSVGIVVPIIRKRVAVQFQLDTSGTAANVGPNPHRTAPTAPQSNLDVQTQLAGAATQLQNRLTSCQASPGAAGCSALLLRQAEAQQLILSSQAFASDLAALYGSASGTGSAFVPTAQSTAQSAIALRVADFNARYRDLLSSSTDLIVAVPRAAGGPAGPADFQRYVVDDLGRDSINTQERVGIGDVELGFKMRVLDLQRTTSRRVGAQLAIAGSVRLPTGSTQSPSEIIDMRLGNGLTILDTRILLDLQAGRLGLFAGGQFAGAFFGDTALRYDKARVEIQVAPRWHLSGPLALHAAYSIRYTESAGDELLGGGVSYSTLANYKGTGALPIEMRFTHLEAVKGDALRPKFFRDQLELRLYYRLH